MILVDTNVIARTFQKTSDHFRPAVDCIELLRVSQRETLCISPQVIVEFYAISTRQRDGLALSPDEAIHHIQMLKQHYAFLPDHPAAFAQWESLISKYKPTNRRVFDVRHVALMLCHNIPKILTFNDADFQPITEIQAVNPFDVLKIPRV